MKIRIIHTGGTIGSIAGVPLMDSITSDSTDYHREPEKKPSQQPGTTDSAERPEITLSDHAVSALVDDFFKESDITGMIEFRESRPLNVLSENMTPSHWETLIAHLKTIPFSDYGGLIITHGTDTLAYTSCLLSQLLDNIPIPVILVSANKPLSMTGTNGFTNFNAAVRLIIWGLTPGVYVAYRNQSGKTYLHAGEDILQSQALSQDFFSQSYRGDAGFPLCEITGAPIPESLLHGEDFHKTKQSRLYEFNGKFAKVIAIQPYIGLDYSNINLNGAAAVIHGLYHSRTAAVNVAPADDSYSLLYLNERCKKNGIPLYMAPFGSETTGSDSLYETTAQLLSAGVIPIYANTFEFAYTKLLIDMSLD